MKRVIQVLVLLSAAAGLAGSHAASALTLTRHPSLWKVTPNSILIAWQTDVAAAGKVLYGASSSFGSEVSDPTVTTNHGVTLTGLDPATRYYYRIVSGADSLTSGDDTLHTAPSGPAPFRFVAFGDCGTGDANQTAVAARIDALNPDLGLVLGDVIYESGEAANFTPRYFTPYRATIRRSVFYPVVGNHDIVTSNGQPFLDAFYLPTNSADGTEKYYSFDYGNAHFVAIDGNQTANTTMYNWVEADLAASTARWKFAYFHQPMYSNPGVHGSDLTLRAYLEPIFVNHQVDVVFQGHNHYFSRSYPIANGVAVDTAQGSEYRNPAGVIYLVSGGGGRVLYTVSPNDPLTRSAFSVFHTMVVDVAGDSIYIQAVKPDGTVFDSLSITKSEPTAIEIASFTASPDPEGIRLTWTVAGATAGQGFNIYRAPSVAEAPERINRSGLLAGGPEYSYLDRDVTPGQTYVYRLGWVDASGQEEITGLAEASAGDFHRFALREARPNPFDRGTDISFALPDRSPVTIRITDSAGRRVRDLVGVGLGAGVHSIRWDGRDEGGRPAASGVYFARLISRDRIASARLVLIR